MNAHATNGGDLRVAVVGLGGIARLHFHAIEAARGVRLTAVCDLNAELVATHAVAQGAKGYTDMAAMLAAEKPDIVTIATDTRSHARLTLLAARAGVRAIHCEKPMAVKPSEAREMVAVCEQAGVLLTINHQRRMGDVAVVRAQIEAGLIGEVLEVHGYCAGDLLTDGTHVVDSLLALVGDPHVNEVLGALDLSVCTARYGHPVEKGIYMQLATEAGLRMTVSTGSFADRRAYQEYHVVGSRGSLWRTGDGPSWFISDGQPGTHAAQFDRHCWFTHPLPATDGGPWRLLDTGGVNTNHGAISAYEKLVTCLTAGGNHPLAGRRTLQVQNIITAGYLSGMRRAPVPLAETETVNDFPLNHEAAPSIPSPSVT